MKVVSRNKRASHRYHIEETFDGGLALTGPEVKSLRAGQATLDDGFGRLDKGEAWLWNVHIAPYKQGSLHVAQDPTRRRKVLLQRAQLKRLEGKLSVKGLTLVPLEIYFADSGYAKVKLALARGKLGPDRREDLKRKTVQREMRRQFSGKQRV